MKKRSRRGLWAALIGLVGLGGCVGRQENFSVVQDFQLELYLGHWHEIARLDHSFERGLSRVSADYSMEDGRIRVLNRGYQAKRARWKEAVGKVHAAGTPGEGRLRVSFFGPFYGAYNIIALEPDYSAALVCGPDLRWLWILARQPVLDPEVRGRFLAQARQLGFPVDDLIFVEQGETPQP